MDAGVQFGGTTYADSFSPCDGEEQRLFCFRHAVGIVDPQDIINLVDFLGMFDLASLILRFMLFWIIDEMDNCILSKDINIGINLLQYHPKGD